MMVLRVQEKYRLLKKENRKLQEQSGYQGFCKIQIAVPSTMAAKKKHRKSLHIFKLQNILLTAVSNFS